MHDWNLLMTRFLSKLKDVESTVFQTCLRVFTTNNQADAYNLERMMAPGKPVARIEAINKMPDAKDATDEEASGLDPVVWLAKGARAMLTANIWTEAGLVNGATGEVNRILSDLNEKPPAMPKAVLVIFPQYHGPIFYSSPEGKQCIPITPTTRQWESKTMFQNAASTSTVVCQNYTQNTRQHAG